MFLVFFDFRYPSECIDVTEARVWFVKVQFAITNTSHTNIYSMQDSCDVITTLQNLAYIN